MTEIFSFSGRYARIQYLVIALLVSVLGSVIIGICAFYFEELGYAVFVIGGLAGFAWFWVGLAAFIKRFHDLNLSGWFVLPWIVISSVPGLIPDPIVSVVFSAILAIMSILILVMPGTAGPNRFGEPHAKLVFFS